MNKIANMANTLMYHCPHHAIVVGAGIKRMSPRGVDKVVNNIRIINLFMLVLFLTEYFFMNERH